LTRAGKILVRARLPAYATAALLTVHALNGQFSALRNFTASIGYALMAGRKEHKFLKGFASYKTKNSYESEKRGAKIHLRDEK
jgi:hypothetical protein